MTPPERVIFSHTLGTFIKVVILHLFVILHYVDISDYIINPVGIGIIFGFAHC